MNAEPLWKCETGVQETTKEPSVDCAPLLCKKGYSWVQKKCKCMCDVFNCPVGQINDYGVCHCVPDPNIFISPQPSSCSAVECTGGSVLNYYTCNCDCPYKQHYSKVNKRCVRDDCPREVCPGFGSWVQTDCSCFCDLNPFCRGISIKNYKTCSCDCPIQRHYDIFLRTCVCNPKYCPVGYILDNFTCECVVDPDFLISPQPSSCSAVECKGSAVLDYYTCKCNCFLKSASCPALRPHVDLVGCVCTN